MFGTNDRVPRLAPALFFVSAVGLAYELVFMRIFAITQWHHFAYMMISIAMLGFGAAGTILTLFGNWVRPRAAKVFRGAMWLTAAAVPLCYLLSQRVPFETYRIAVEHSQWFYLFLLYLILAIPFFLVSACIATSFMLLPKHIGKVYFVNMCGSGMGALGITLCMYLFPPHQLVAVVAAVALLAFLFSVSKSGIGQLQLAGCIVIVSGLALISVWQRPRVSEYKELSYVMDLPDAELKARVHSPISEVSAVTSKYLRETPGQIANYPMEELGPLPPQIGLFFDAGGTSVINRFTGDFDDFAFLDYVTAALPYQVRLAQEPKVFIVGSGGGTDVLMALRNQAKQVTAVEIDPHVFNLVDNVFGNFSGRIYSRDDVRPVIADGRGWLEGNPEEKFDLIQIALLDSFSAASAGVHALSETYLYTTEAIETYFDRLSDHGMLSVTRWLRTPPRDAIKMFGTLVEGAENAGVEDPSRHMLWIRSWNTATLILAKSPFTDAQIEEARAFARERNLDICYLPGIQRDEANRYTVLETPEYFDAAQNILFGNRRDFYRNFLYFIEPPTDDRPYFFRFSKWRSIPRLIRGMGHEWIPFVEWGYLALLATVVQGAVASVLLILCPLLVFVGRNAAEVRGRRLPVVAYFGLLGLAFMFLEIAFIQKMMLFLHYPVYAVAVVLTSFMFFSGLGSLAAERHQNLSRRLQPAVILALVGIGVALVFGSKFLFDWGISWPDSYRIAFGLLLLAPLAFLMGMPFPLGLQRVSNQTPQLVPWAWAVNGCLSVIGATLATLTAVHSGFKLLVLLAAFCYLLTIPVYRRISES